MDDPARARQNSLFRQLISALPTGTSCGCGHLPIVMSVSTKPVNTSVVPTMSHGRGFRCRSQPTLEVVPARGSWALSLYVCDPEYWEA